MYFKTFTYKSKVVTLEYSKTETYPQSLRNYFQF